MALVPCPSCASAVSHRAETCVHCGYDLMPAPARAVAEPPVRVRRGRLIAAALAGTVALLVLLGSLISVAAPRPAAPHEGAAPEAPRDGGVADVLTHVLELQREHLAHFGEYTANLTEEAEDDFLNGYDPAIVPAGYTLVVLEAGASELCVQASPDVDAPAEAPTLTIDETGAIHEGAVCTDEVALAPPLASS